MGLYTEAQAEQDHETPVQEEAHSILGASGAERWMNCPGSTALIQAFDLPQSDEPDYLREGIAGHEAAADCLARDIDSWEIAGDTYHDQVIDEKIADAIQMYLDTVRPSIDRTKYHGQQFFIEAKLAAPELHAKMFGTVDFGAMALIEGINGTQPFLDVTDLKMGVGIVIDAVNNPQMMYYALMLMALKFPDLADDFPVRLTICQPRAYHPDGPVRVWWTTAGDIRAWSVRELLPAMNSTDDALQAGEWCRFCPAKLACPLVDGLFKAAANYDPKAVVDLSDEALGLSYGQGAAVRFYLKAMEAEALRRSMTGKVIPNTKLVHQRADRIFKETVTEKVEGVDVEIPMLDAIKKRFGADAFTEPKLKSPAQLSELGPAAKEFAKEYAYLPTTGLTLAAANDRRIGVKVETAQERFGTAVANLTAEASTGD